MRQHGKGRSVPASTSKITIPVPGFPASTCAEDRVPTACPAPSTYLPAPSTRWGRRRKELRRCKSERKGTLTEMQRLERGCLQNMQSPQ